MRESAGAGVVVAGAQSGRGPSGIVGKGVTISREAAEEPWGLWEMHIHDPDGTLIQLVEVPVNHSIRHGFPAAAVPGLPGARGAARELRRKNRQCLIACPIL